MIRVRDATSLRGARRERASLIAAFTSHLIVGMGLDAATTSKLAGHANQQITMRVYADDFRQASERNAAVLARAADVGFGA
jgi:integrase